MIKKLALVQSLRRRTNLVGLFWVLNGLDAALALMGLSQGAQELNPLWGSYPILYSMGLKLGLAGLAGWWFYMKGWSWALAAGNIWLAVVVGINLITLIIVL